MTRKINDFLKMIFISPEFLVILVCAAVYIYWPSIYETISIWLAESDKWIYLLGLLGGGLMYSIYLSKEILFPSSGSNNKILINWPDYGLLKSRTYFSICISSTGFVGVFGLWIVKDLLASIVSGLIFVVCALEVFISLATLVFASFAIKAFIEGDS